MSRPTDPDSRAGRGDRTGQTNLAPGAVVGDGRYRLLARFGVDDEAAAQLWRARDSQLGRDVAVSVLVGNPADRDAATKARRTLDRAMHSATFTHPTVARVIDVLGQGSGIAGHEGVLGMIVAEWSPGTDLIDLVAEGAVRPNTAAALLEPLTSAVEQAHQSGIVLGVGHPQRIRVTREGELRLAFPGASPDATLRDDVRGLGALLYLLLTGRWPLDNGPDGLPAAPSGPDGTLVPPKTLQPSVSSELSNLSVRCLADGRNTVSGIRTSAAILAVLERVADDATAQSTGAPATTQAATEEDTGDDTVWTTGKPQRDPARRKRLAIAVGVLGVATVAVLVWLVTGVIGFFSDSGGSPNGPKAVAPSASSSKATTQPASSASKPQGPMKPSGVEVFNVSGDADGSDSVSRTIDGDPDTEWSTQTYQQNFPAIKPGVGVVAKFDKPVTVGEVDVDSPSQGTQVEVRTADSPDADLDDTKVVSRSAGLDRTTKIKLSNYKPSKYLVVWVKKLASDGGQYQSKISELHFRPAQS